MNKTEINWTELTWNPASGCEKISAGCKHCYADQLAEQKRGTAAFPRGFDLTIREHKLAEPTRVRRPSLIFTSSMTDVFHLPEDYRTRVFETIRATPWHRYQLLTKRIDVAEEWCRRYPLPPNVWMGCTIEHQDTAWRAEVLRRIPASIHFVSAEPLVGRLDLDCHGIDWLIAGGESGIHLSRSASELAARGLVRRGDRGRGEPSWVPREDRVEWVRLLRDRCAEAGAAFWFKQWGGPRPKSGGRLLDGREHDGMPTHIGSSMPEGYQHGERGFKKHQLDLVAQQTE